MKIEFLKPSGLKFQKKFKINLEIADLFLYISHVRGVTFSGQASALPTRRIVMSRRLFTGLTF